MIDNATCHSHISEAIYLPGDAAQILDIVSMASSQILEMSHVDAPMLKDVLG
jgi:hypothetical protein